MRYGTESARRILNTGSHYLGTPDQFKKSSRSVSSVLHRLAHFSRSSQSTDVPDEVTRPSHRDGGRTSGRTRAQRAQSGWPRCLSDLSNSFTCSEFSASYNIRANKSCCAISNASSSRSSIDVRTTKVVCATNGSSYVRANSTNATSAPKSTSYSRGISPSSISIYSIYLPPARAPPYSWKTRSA